MVKGLTRRVIIIKTPDPRLFDEAIFIVREEAGKGGVSGEEIVNEAMKTADRYVRTNLAGKHLPHLSPLIYMAIGASLTGIAWVLTVIL